MKDLYNNHLALLKQFDFLDQVQLNKFDIYKDLLQKWSKIHNLTGSTDEQSLYANIIDSIYPIKFLDLSNIHNIADIGSGAGFPAIPLAIVLPNIEFILIEPRSKRVSFLNTVKLNLKLNNIKIISKRVEQIIDLKADMIISRAVANTNLLLDISSNIALSNTQYLLYKGQDVSNEIANLKNYDIIKFSNRNYLWIKALYD